MSALTTATAPYGIKAVRQIRAPNTTSGATMPSQRLQQRKERTFKYFLEKVDPVLGDCITYLLLEQPPDVAKSMIDFLSRWTVVGEGLVRAEDLPRVKPKKELKLYLATSIGPIIAKLMNRVAVSLPEDVIKFMISELESMIKEGELLPDVSDIDVATQAIQVGRRESAAAYPTLQNEVESQQQVNKPSSMTSDSPAAAPISSAQPVLEPRKIQIAVLGLGGVGKTTIMNCLQGKFDPLVKPTVGFRPLTLVREVFLTLARIIMTKLAIDRLDRCWTRPRPSLCMTSVEAKKSATSGQNITTISTDWSTCWTRQTPWSQTQRAFKPS